MGFYLSGLVILCCFILYQEVNSAPVNISQPVQYSDYGSSVRIEGTKHLVTIDLSYLGKSIYGNPSPSTGAKVAQLSSGSTVNPDELGDYAQGDILQGPVDDDIAYMPSLWEGGVIPYVINSRFNYRQRNVIMQAIGDFHQHTCVRFIPRTTEENYIFIGSSSSGCYSSVGRVGRGAQTINLQIPQCVQEKGTAIHELMHSIGLGHEQARADRDDHVVIMWHNVAPALINNFWKQDTQVDTFDIEYDYDSMMHYTNNAFSWTGYDTILTKDYSDRQFGQRKGFSPGDIKKINMLYQCNGYSQTDSHIATSTKLVKKCYFYIYCYYDKEYIKPSKATERSSPTITRCAWGDLGCLLNKARAMVTAAAQTVYYMAPLVTE